MTEEKEDSNIARLLTPKKEAKKRQYSFYLNEKLYKAFMDTCKSRFAKRSGSDAVLGR